MLGACALAWLPQSHAADSAAIWNVLRNRERIQVTSKIPSRALIPSERVAVGCKSDRQTEDSKEDDSEKRAATIE